MSGKRETQVVSGGGGTSVFSPSHVHLSRRAGMLAAAAVVIIAILFGYQYYHSHKHQAPPKSAPKISSGTTAKLKPITVDYVQLDENQLTSKVNYLIGTQQLAEADKLISMQNDLNTNKVKLSLLANIQGLEGKKTEAAATAAKIAALSDLSPGQYEQIGRQYAAAGDKTKATEYYNKAIDAYNARHQGSYQADVARVQGEIKELQ